MCDSHVTCVVIVAYSCPQHLPADGGWGVRVFWHSSLYGSFLGKMLEVLWTLVGFSCFLEKHDLGKLFNQLARWVARTQTKGWQEKKEASRFYVYIGKINLTNLNRSSQKNTHLYIDLMFNACKLCKSNRSRLFFQEWTPSIPSRQTNTLTFNPQL